MALTHAAQNSGEKIDSKLTKIIERIEFSYSTIENTFSLMRSAASAMEPGSNENLPD